MIIKPKLNTKCYVLIYSIDSMSVIANSMMTKPKLNAKCYVLIDSINSVRYAMFELLQFISRQLAGENFAAVGYDLLHGVSQQGEVFVPFLEKLKIPFYKSTFVNF